MDNRGPQIQATAILFLILSWISVSLRCYVRTFITRRFGLDDWLAVLSLVVFTLFCTVVLLGEATGTGRHKNDISASDMTKSLMWWWCGELTYSLSTWLVKLCIAFFLMKICVLKYQIVILWTTVIVFTIYTIFYTFFMAFQCHPVSLFWTGDPGNGSCMDPTAVTFATYAHSALSVVVDWTLGILPVFLVWDLQMNPRTKLSVAIILGLGAIGSIATIIRIPYIHLLSITEDFLYVNTDVSIWSTVEPGIGITAASIACLKPLFRTFFSLSTIHSSDHVDKNQWSPSRRGYVRSGQDNFPKDIGSRNGSGKGILATSFIAIEPINDSTNMDRDIELVAHEVRSVR